MDPIIVTDPEKCPFRYCDQEYGTYECTFLTEDVCDQGDYKQVAKQTREPVEGATLLDYELIQVFTFPPECPFGGKSFTVSVEQG